MNATRTLLVLAGLVPMTTGPLDVLIGDAPAAEVRPARAAAHRGLAGAVPVHLCGAQPPSERHTWSRSSPGST